MQSDLSNATFSQPRPQQPSDELPKHRLPTHQLSTNLHANFHSITPHAIYSALHTPHSPLPHPPRLQASTQRSKTYQSSTAQHEYHAKRRPELADGVLHLLKRHAEVRHHQTGGQEEDGEFREEQGDAGQVLDVEGFLEGEEGEVLGG